MDPLGQQGDKVGQRKRSSGARKVGLRDEHAVVFGFLVLFLTSLFRFRELGKVDGGRFGDDVFQEAVQEFRTILDGCFGICGQLEAR